MVKNEVKAIILIAVLVPVAFTLFFGANTTGWDATTILVWALVPVLAIVGLLIKNFLNF